MSIFASGFARHLQLWAPIQVMAESQTMQQPLCQMHPASPSGTQRGREIVLALAAMARKPTKNAARWSQRVTASSNALDLDPNIFRSGSSKRVAASLKRSADRSHRRKGTPFQAAMSMLTFYINRAGTNLSAERKRILKDAKGELRRLYRKITRASSHAS
jgi:hypothetical protein